MVSELVRIHHAAYTDDIPFWIKETDGLDPILEVGCGHGRLTLPLLEAGHDLVGVDQDPGPIAYLRGVIRELSDEKRQRVNLVNCDILTFHPQVSFAGVIIPCNTYSTFNPKNRLRLLAKAKSWLRTGGLLAVSLPNPRQTLEALGELSGTGPFESPELETVITHPQTGFPVQVSSRLRAGQESLLWDWIYDHLYPNGQVERGVVTVEHFLASGEEILAEVEQVGFRDLNCRGDYAGAEYSESSPYLIVTSRI